jgi:hypothetical protein
MVHKLDEYSNLQREARLTGQLISQFLIAIVETAGKNKRVVELNVQMQIQLRDLVRQLSLPSKYAEVKIDGDVHPIMAGESDGVLATLLKLLKGLQVTENDADMEIFWSTLVPMLSVLVPDDGPPATKGQTPACPQASSSPRLLSRSTSQTSIDKASTPDYPDELAEEEQVMPLTTASSSCDSVAPKMEAARKLRVKPINVLSAPLPVGQLPFRGSAGSSAPSLATAETSALEVAPRMPGSPDPIPAYATTAIIRNIPARCTRKHLLEKWPPMGSYNMLHQPYCYKRQRTLGFAIINFFSNAALVDFQEKWHGQYLVPAATTKRLEVAMADEQGMEANLMAIRHTYSMNRIKHMQKHAPTIILPDGSFVDFHAAMNAIEENNLSMDQ